MYQLSQRNPKATAIVKHRRYPGAHPYTTDQAPLFFGRTKDIDQLYQLVSLEELVVLYGQSGMGKSSLINAGLIPLLEKERQTLPLTFRFNAWTPDATETPLSISQTQLTFGPPAESPLDRLLPSDRSLWKSIKARQFAQPRERLLLLFDQFEELFTYPQAQIDAFKKELAELLRSYPPARFEKILEIASAQTYKPLSPAEEDQLYSPLNLRIVFSIRSDQMSCLDQLSDYLSVKRAWYELRPLSVKQATAAIVMPAAQSGTFSSPGFSYEPGAIEHIMHYLTKGYQQPIETFQLQIVCQSIEQKVYRQQLRRVGVSDLGDLEQVFENYYENQIDLLAGEAEKAAAKQLIEEGLIFEDEKRRISLYEGQIHKTYGVDDQLLRQLVDTHLLRAIPSEKGGFKYELSHDTLVAPVLKSYARRKAEKAKAEKAAERHRAKRKLLGAMGFSLFSLLLAGISFFFYLQARQESRKAISNAIVAHSVLETQKNKDMTRGFRLAQMGWHLQPGNTEAQTALYESFYQQGLPDARLFYSRQLDQHTDAVRQVAYSPDGRFILSTSNDKTAKIYDREGRELTTLRGHTQKVTYGTFSSNGDYLITLSEDSTAILYDFNDGAPKSFATLKDHGNVVVHASFSPDARRVVTASADRSALLWALEPGPERKVRQVARLPHRDKVWSAAFSPDGQYLVTASEDSTAVIWDARAAVAPAQPLVQLLGHTQGVLRAKFSPDGRFVMSCSRDGTVRLWDARPGLGFGHLLADLKAHDGWVRSAEFSPDGEQLLTYAYDHTAKIWDLSNFQPIDILLGHQGPILDAQFSPDGRYLVTASKDKSLLVWDLRQKPLRRVASLTGHLDEIYAIDVSPDGQDLLSGSLDGTVKIWEVRSWSPKNRAVVPFAPHQGEVRSASFAPDGQQLLTSGEDGLLIIWDLQGNPLDTLRPGLKQLWSANFSPDKRHLVVTGDSNRVLLYQRAGEGRPWEAQPPFIGHQSRIRFADFSPDGRYIASASDDATVRIWDLKGESIQVFRGFKNVVEAVHFSPDGRHLVIGGWDHLASLWTKNQGQWIKKATLKGHSSPIKYVSFSPDSKQVLTASSDKTARLWDVATLSSNLLSGHDQAVTSASFSPDGHYLLTASLDGRFIIWNLRGKPIVSVKGHEKGLWSAHFSPDGQYIVTASRDQTAKLWPFAPELLFTKAEEMEVGELSEGDAVKYGVSLR